MNEEDVVRYWEHMAEQWDPSDGERVIFDSLLSIAGNNPHLLRGVIEAAARAIGRRFCTHGETTPEPLHDVKKLKLRVEAAKKHPGLCGVHHAGYIGGINYQDVLDRMPEGGGPVTTKKMRNQVRGRTGNIYLSPAALL